MVTVTMDEERKKLIDHLKGWRNCTNTKCEDCPFSNPMGTKRVCTVMEAPDLIDLALKVVKNDEVLLKEQEAELSYRCAKTITHTATKLDDATCPSCGNVVGEKIRTGAIGQSVVQVRWDYCRFCGQKLDWEGRVK